MRVHLVTAGFETANGQGLLAPLIRLRQRLHGAGVDLRLLSAAGEAAADCDVLAIESRFLRGGWSDGSALRTLESAASRNPALVYFDIHDSTGSLQPQVLPFVRRYLKNQLLRDRSLYRRAQYGDRLFTDFVHRKFGVSDADELTSEPVADAADLAKLGVSWNSGLADYGLGGIVRRELYRRTHLKFLIRRPVGFADPAAHRPIEIAFRMTRNYARATVAFQRVEVARLLGVGAERRLRRPAFLRELERTRLAISPFGWGEINLRDYEACIAGAALAKPDMSHLETWPDLYVAGETYMPFRWDLSDVAETVMRAKDDPETTVAVAARAQARYRDAVASEAGDAAFVARFAGLIRAALPARS
ncbi:MAG: hypothetical protein JNN22_08645 [Rhodospirillales bacterium]|nr:hypothetical protein [Rhodospirillales bacterium]